MPQGCPVLPHPLFAQGLRASWEQKLLSPAGAPDSHQNQGQAPFYSPAALAGRPWLRGRGRPLGLQGRVGLTGSLNHGAGWGQVSPTSGEGEPLPSHSVSEFYHKPWGKKTCR